MTEELIVKDKRGKIFFKVNKEGTVLTENKKTLQKFFNKFLGGRLFNEDFELEEIETRKL